MRPLAAADLLAHVDHLVPRLGRGRHEVLAVPQQLRVRPDRHGVEAVLEARRLQDGAEDVLADDLRRARRHRARSSRRWRTRRSRRRRGRAGPATGPRRRGGARAARAAGRPARAGTRTRSCTCRRTAASSGRRSSAGAPLGSLKMNQRRVTAPPLDESSLPHATSPAQSTAAAIAMAIPLRMAPPYPAELVAKLTNYRFARKPSPGPSSRGRGRARGVARGVRRAHDLARRRSGPRARRRC